MKCEIRQSGRTTFVALEGDCTIESAQELKDTLLDALNGADAVVMNLDKIAVMDMALMQLICSAHKASRAREKSFSLDGKLPQACARTAKRSGYLRKIGCHKDPREDCLWSEDSNTGGRNR